MGRDHDLARIQALVVDPGTTAVVVTAPAGAGKTRLVRELERTAAVPPLWLQAGSAVAAVPFGALTELIDPGPADPGEILHRLTERAAESGGLIVVDDAPYLDARSADLLQRMVAGSSLTVVATARAGVAVPAWLEWLWLGEATHHLTVDPLDGSATSRLVHLVLGHAASRSESDIAAALISRTGGNALFLRELLLNLRLQVDEGREVEVGAAAPAHLLRVLEARQRAAGDAVLGVLQDVSVLGSLPLALVEQRRGADAVAAAERAVFVVVSDGIVATVRPAHPLQAEAALGILTTGERRKRTADIARSVLNDSAARSSERLGATTALVEIGAAVPTETLVEAARTAFAALDHELASRLSAAAVAAGDPFEAKVVLGAAHSGAGRPDAAELALRDALASATNDDERARAVGRLSVHLVAHGSRIDEAADLLEGVRSVIADPAARAFLAADLAKLASIRGNLADVSTEIDENADDLTVLNAAIVGAYAQAMAGDAHACRATIATALPLADANRAVLPWSAELVRFSGPFAALVEAGPTAAVNEAARGLVNAIDGVKATVGTWRFLQGFTAAVAGQMSGAVEALTQAEDELAGHDLIGARALAVATNAWCAAQIGDVDGARLLLDRSVDAALADGRVRVQVAVADAWCDVRERGSTTAGVVAKVREAALDAADGGQVLTAVIVLNELIRLGAPAEAAAPLKSIARVSPESWLVRFVLDRARAEAAGDELALSSLARRAASRWPVALAELHATRHRLAAARGDDVAAARAAFETHWAADQLGSDVPWPLGDVPAPLTEREGAVAWAVGHGASSRAVAESAGVSTRTIEHQLQSTYRKLGLKSRAELAVFLLRTPAPEAQATDPI